MTIDELIEELQKIKTCLTEIFDIEVCIENCGREKPSPDGYVGYVRLSEQGHPCLSVYMLQGHHPVCDDCDRDELENRLSDIESDLDDAKYTLKRIQNYIDNATDIELPEGCATYKKGYREGIVRVMEDIEELLEG